MDFTLRTATAADLPDIGRVDGVSFGSVPSEQDLADAFDGVDLDRFVVALDGDRIVGVAGDYPFNMTAPGGAVLPVAGVTWVSVLPTHRRRGILRAMLERQLRSYVDEGLPAAILTASQGGIYRRFGYGWATSLRKITIQLDRVQLRHPVDTSQVRLVEVDEARTLLPELHARWAAVTPGALSRSESWWDRIFRDRESNRGGMSARFYLVHPEGYLCFRAKPDWGDGHPRHQCFVSDYAPVTAEAHAALWQVLFGMDLYGQFECHQMPADDPLPFLLTNPRAVETEGIHDGIWIRPIDVGALLSQRRYATEIDVVIEVTDELLGTSRSRLIGGSDGAEVQPSTAEPDLVMSPDALGSLYLGEHRLHTLVDAGAVHVRNPQQLTRLDIALQAERGARHGTGF